MNPNSGSWGFDPSKSFLNLPTVLFTIAVFMGLSFSITAIIAFNEHREFCGGGASFNTAISIFRFPLGLAALTIPVVGLFAANHRSEQTKAQLAAATSQNNFANYFKHYEEFAKHISELSWFEVGDKSRVLHKWLFPRVLEARIQIRSASSHAVEEEAS